MLGGALEGKMAPNWKREGARGRPGSLGTRWEGEAFVLCVSFPGEEEAPTLRRVGSRRHSAGNQDRTGSCRLVCPHF